MQDKPLHPGRYKREDMKEEGDMKEERHDKVL